MSRWLYLLVLSSLVLTMSVVEGAEKVGWIWHNQITGCTGIAEPVVAPNPFGRTVHVQALRVFMGAKAIAYTGPIDAGVLVEHSNGSLIEMLQRDIYTEPTGITDVSSLRQFQTPWVFGPTEYLRVLPGCNQWGSGNPINPTGVVTEGAVHVIIAVEGYLE